MQLRGDEEAIHRVGKDQQVAGGDGLGRAAHVALENMDTGAGVEKLKLMLRKSLFKVETALQRDAEPAARRTVYNKDLHARSFPCLSDRITPVYSLPHIGPKIYTVSIKKCGLKNQSANRVVG